MANKRKLFHMLNQRARREKERQEQREYDILKDKIEDPRRREGWQWLRPLIKESDE